MGKRIIRSKKQSRKRQIREMRMLGLKAILVAKSTELKSDTEKSDGEGVVKPRKSVVFSENISETKIYDRPSPESSNEASPDDEVEASPDDEVDLKPPEMLCESFTSTSLDLSTLDDNILESRPPQQIHSETSSTTTEGDSEENLQKNQGPDMMKPVFPYHVQKALSGQGTEVRIELKNSTSRGEVKLGTARIGQIIRKTVPIVNRSSAEAKFTLSIAPGQNALQESGVLGVYPSNQITMAPKESRDIEVVFAPKPWVAPFRVDVILESFGSSKPFLSLIGACHAIQVSLDQDAVPFGTVVYKSTSERRVVISNTGDIGVKFEWDADQLR